MDCIEIESTFCFGSVGVHEAAKECKQWKGRIREHSEVAEDGGVKGKWGLAVHCRGWDNEFERFREDVSLGVGGRVCEQAMLAEEVFFINFCVEFKIVVNSGFALSISELFVFEISNLGG